MKIQYDTEVDALSIKFNNLKVMTQHLSDVIALDYDENGFLAGIEILDAKEKLGDFDFTSKIEFEQIGQPLAINSI